MPRIRTTTKTVTTAKFDDYEVELYHKPYEGYDESIFAERVGDTLIVAYLVHDDDAYHANPMEGCAQGNIYTKPCRYGGGIITDDEHELRRALRLNNYDAPDIDYEFNGTTLRDLAADEMVARVSKDDDLASKWSDYLDEKVEEGDPIVVDSIELRKDLMDCNGCFSEEVEELAVEMYSKHWEAIVGPYVVPISHHSERGSTMMAATDWDGDPDDLPDGVWVADDDAIENICHCLPQGWEVGQIRGDDGMYTPEYELLKHSIRRWQGTLGACIEFARTQQPISRNDIRAAAVKYAHGVVTEYAKWCEGDVWGCVTETFTLANPREEGDTSDEPDEWEQTDEDSCWGFIGWDYALETLKTEYFESVVARLKQPATV